MRRCAFLREVDADALELERFHCKHRTSLGLDTDTGQADASFAQRPGGLSATFSPGRYSVAEAGLDGEPALRKPQALRQAQVGRDGPQRDLRGPNLKADDSGLRERPALEVDVHQLAAKEKGRTCLHRLPHRIRRGAEPGEARVDVLDLQDMVHDLVAKYQRPAFERGFVDRNRAGILLRRGLPGHVLADLLEAECRRSKPRDPHGRGHQPRVAQVEIALERRQQVEPRRHF